MFLGKSQNIFEDNEVSLESRGWVVITDTESVARFRKACINKQTGAGDLFMPLLNKLKRAIGVQ